MADIDIERVANAIVATLKAHMPSEIAIINDRYSDFDIAVVPTANYSIERKKVLPAKPWVYVTGNVDIETGGGGTREGWHLIEVVFLHDFPERGWDQETTTKYCMRIGAVISQVLKDNFTLGLDDILYTEVQAIRRDDSSYSNIKKVRNVVIAVRVLEHEDTLIGGA